MAHRMIAWLRATKPSWYWLFLVFAIGAGARGSLFRDLNLGSLAEWVAGLLAAGALSYALFEAADSRNQAAAELERRNEEARRSQAITVEGWTSAIRPYGAPYLRHRTFEVSVANRGPLTIRNVRAATPLGTVEFSLVLPGRVHSHRFLVSSDTFAEEVGESSVVLDFVDAASRSWRRLADGSLVSDPDCSLLGVPIAAGWTPAPIDERPMLSRGSRSDYVIYVQAAIQALGLYNLTTGFGFGPRTEEAVKKLQAHVGIPADGLVGPETWLGLEEMLARELGSAEIQAIWGSVWQRPRSAM